MKDRFDRLRNCAVVGTTALAVGAACSSGVEGPRTVEASPDATRSASAAAEVVLGTIVNTEDSDGETIGVNAYGGPDTSPDDVVGWYPEGATLGFDCYEKGRKGADYNVPRSPDPVVWDVWYKVDADTGQWIPKPFVNLQGGELQPCQPA